MFDDHAITGIGDNRDNFCVAHGEVLIIGVNVVIASGFSPALEQALLMFAGVMSSHSTTNSPPILHLSL